MLIKNFIAPLLDTWVESYDKLPDNLRSEKVLGRILGNSKNIVIREENDWILFLPEGEHSGRVIILGDTDHIAIRRVMRNLIDDLSLVRLTTKVPGPVTNHIAFLRKVGFRKEGRMRQAVTYNGQLADQIILGFLASDKKGRKRRRRSRRAKS